MELIFEWDASKARRNLSESEVEMLLELIPHKSP
jgi:uncharacterized DUF497 family protein